MASPHKRHHQVPQFYLQRFASDGKVMVRRRDGTGYCANPVNVAVESGFYDIPDGIGGKSKEIESGLAEIEGMADAVLRKVDGVGAPPGPTDPDRAALALFIGLQLTRTTQHRERVMFPRRVLDWAKGRDLTPELVAEYLETEYLGFRPDPGEVDGAFTVVSVAAQDEPNTLKDEFGVEMMLRSAREISARLLQRNWCIEFDRRREFITSDAPVVLWRKPTRRDDFEGIGPETAEELRFPLDPGKQMVLSRRGRRPSVDVAVHRVRRSNADMAGACHRFIIGSPDNRVQMNAQRLDKFRPVMRFNVAPLVEEGPDGQVRPGGGDVVHMWTPRRASAGHARRLRD